MNELLKALAMEAKALNESDGTSVSQFVLEMAEYPDFMVKKTTPTQIKRLVVMPSVGKCFIKTESKKGTFSEVLTEKNYSSFSSGMPDIILPEGFWCSALTKGIATARDLLRIFEDDLLLEIIRQNCYMNCDFLAQTEYDSNAAVTAKKVYVLNPKLIKEFCGDKNSKAFRMLYNSPEFILYVTLVFGIENARDFLREYNESLVDCYYLRDSNELCSYRALYDWESSEYADKFLDAVRNCYDATGKYFSSYSARCYLPDFPIVKMDYSAFKNYVLYGSVRFGYALSISNFMQIWLDTLNMEHNIYGKIKEKYPQDLPLLHNQMSYKSTLMDMEINEEKFAASVEAASAYEGTYRDFVFIAPKERQDIFNEAVMQANCLAGYVSDFTEGNCILFFMRKKNAPKRSYITVELRDGHIRQAKKAFNKEPSTNELAILANWVSKCNRDVAKAS